MNINFYKELVKKSPLGYAYHRIICDEKGVPYDFEFLDINESFEILTGLKRKDILNQTVLTVMPNIRDDNFDWISFYGEVALGGPYKEFEQYSEPLNRYYHVNVYSPKKYYFVTVFSDITTQVQMTNISKKLIEYSVEQIDYQKIADDMRKLSGAKYVTLNLFDDSSLGFTTVAVSGTYEDSNKSVVVKIMNEDRLLGDFTLVVNPGKNKVPEEMLKIYASQIGLVLEKKRAEEKLHESENRLELFFKQSLSGCFFMMLDQPVEWNDTIDKEKVLDYVFAHQRITKVNEAMLKQYGITEEDFLNKTPNELFAHNVEYGKKVWKDFFDHGQLHINTNEQRPDGTQMWIEGDYICLYDLDGRIIGHFGTQQDVTERKKTKQNLVERDLLLTKISQQVPGAIYQYQFQPNGLSYFPFATEGIWDIYEVTPAEVRYDASIVYSRIHPEDYDHVVASIQHSYRTLSIWEDEYRVNLPKKGTIWIRGLARPEKLNDGSVLWHGYLRDISEVKLAEQALFIKKEQFKTTLLSVGDGVISTDAKGNILLLNKIAEQLTGWSLSEAFGKPLGQVFNIINEFTRQKCDNLVCKVLETGNIIELANHTILISKDGREIPIEESVAPIKDDQGNIKGMVLVFKDFTEKKEKQDKIIYLSYYDQLTGLHNRRFFEEELKRLDIEKNLPLTMVLADVNGLKLANDAFGHLMGDRILKKIAQIMKNECDQEDLIARIGGDEFVILLPNTNTEKAQIIVNQIHDAIGKEKVDSINLSVSFGWETKNDLSEDMATIFKKAEDHMYRRKLCESSSMLYSTITLIMKTLYEKNKREEKHSKRVSDLCVKVGTTLNLNKEQINELKTVGLMHDIGKIAIDDDILNKPGMLSETEWLEIKRHPEIGYNILRTVNEYAQLAEYVLSHHERWDGKGYPRGLKGEEIPLLARLISIVDAFDAMTGYRTYRSPLSEEDAIEEIRKNAGTQFDPHMVNVFIESMI